MTAKEKFYKDLKEQALMTIDNDPEWVSFEDLFQVAYNDDYGFIDDQEAQKEIAKYGAFNAIQLVESYETENIGEITTNLDVVCDVLNMTIYILGEKLLTAISEELDMDWDDQLNSKQKKQVESKLEGLTATELNNYLN